MNSATILGAALLREELITGNWWTKLLIKLGLKFSTYYLYFTIVIEQDWGSGAEVDCDLKIGGIYVDEYGVSWLVIDTDGIDYTVRLYPPVPMSEVANYRAHHNMKMGRMWARVG